MRISNTERNEVTDLLSKHYAEGRLDSAEFDERAERALRAKTRGDLAGLLDDLPGLSPPPRSPSRVRPVGRWLVVALLVVLAASLVAAPPHVPWLLVVLVVWLIWHRRHRHGWRGRRAIGSQP